MKRSTLVCAVFVFFLSRGPLPGQAPALTEVFYDPVGLNSGQQIVELHNPGPAPANLGGLWLRFPPVAWQLPAGLSLPPGGYLKVHVNQGGADTATDVYTGTSGMRNLRQADSLALYTSNLFQDPGQLLDFVQWGNAGLGGEDVAVEAGLWDSGTAVNVSSLRAGASIQRQGEGHAAAAWCVDGTPTLGAPNDDCAPSFVQSRLELNEVGMAGVPGSEHSFVEVTNTGDVFEALGGACVALGGSAPYCFPPGALLGPGEIALVHFDSAGADSDFVFFAGEGTGSIVGTEGAASFHAGAEVLDATLLLDFVQWGAPGSPLEAVAAEAGIWTPGEFVEVTARRPWGAVARSAGGWGVDNTHSAGLPNDAPPPPPRAVLNEVLLDPEGEDSGEQIVEIFNPYPGEVDLSGFTLCAASKAVPGTTICYTIPSGQVLGAEGFLLVKVNRVGLNVPGEVYTGPFEDLAREGGELALFYLDDPGNPNDLSDYLRWGEGPVVLEPVASAVGIWPEGDSIDVSALRDHASIAYEGSGDTARSYRVDVSPTLGLPNDACCARLPFVRGDCNDSGTVDLSDAVFGLRFLFRGETRPLCLDACDVNDDAVVDLSDAVFGLSFLFRGGPRPPPPSPGGRCRDDPTDDTVSCDSFLSCPP